MHLDQQIESFKAKKHYEVCCHFSRKTSCSLKAFKCKLSVIALKRNSINEKQVPPQQNKIENIRVLALAIAFFPFIFNYFSIKS